MTLNRKDVRHELAEFLEANMSTPNSVLPSLPATFKGQAPLVCIVGAPTDRRDDTADTHENKFGLSVRLVVLYYLENDTAWTPEMAEDMLDDLEFEFAQALELANTTTGHTWRALSRQGFSQSDPIKPVFLADGLPRQPQGLDRYRHPGDVERGKIARSRMGCVEFGVWCFAFGVSNAVNPFARKRTSFLRVNGRTGQRASVTRIQHPVSRIVKPLSRVT